MVHGPPLLAAQGDILRNQHWVLCFLLVFGTLFFLCLLFDPLYNGPYIDGAHINDSAIVHLIAKQKGTQPRQLKKWDTFLAECGTVAFAIAPLYSTFPHQKDYVSCPPAYLLMLPCILSMRVVKGTMDFPQDRSWLLPKIA